MPSHSSRGGGERSAKTAAGLLPSHLDQLQALDPAQQRPWRLLQAEFAQAVAADVERDRVRKGRAQIGHPEPADQEV